VGRCVVQPQKVEELADLEIELRGMSHSHAPVECVPVPSTRTLAGDVARLDEIGHDALRRPFRDAHDAGDVAKPRVPVALDAEKHLCVTCKEVPVLVFRT
jgi:hypothetical protein